MNNLLPSLPHSFERGKRPVVFRITARSFHFVGGMDKNGIFHPDTSKLAVFALTLIYEMECWFAY